MIELNWHHHINLSTAVMCFTNNIAKQTIVVGMDVKHSLDPILMTFKNLERPTAVFQIGRRPDTNTKETEGPYLLIGTEKGRIELWNLDDDTEAIAVMEAHSGAQGGISNIIEFKDPSPLIVGDKPEAQGKRFIVTTCEDMPEFKIWRLSDTSVAVPKLSIHIKITTSLSGIGRILQTSATQLVCVDNDKTLKFYDFIDKNE